MRIASVTAWSLIHSIALNGAGVQELLGVNENTTVTTRGRCFGRADFLGCSHGKETSAWICAPRLGHGGTLSSKLRVVHVYLWTRGKSNLGPQRPPSAHPCPAADWTLSAQQREPSWISPCTQPNQVLLALSSRDVRYLDS